MYVNTLYVQGLDNKIKARADLAECLEGQNHLLVGAKLPKEVNSFHKMP